MLKGAWSCALAIPLKTTSMRREPRPCFRAARWKPEAASRRVEGSGVAVGARWVTPEQLLIAIPVAIVVAVHRRTYPGAWRLAGEGERREGCCPQELLVRES